MFRNVILFLLSVVLISSTAMAKEKKLPKQVRKLLAMSVEEVAAKIQISDDELDTIATLSSQPVFQHKKGLLGIVWEDNFLRAFVDKKTGVTSFQLYQRISYEGDWRWYNRVNYSTPDGPVSEELTRISSDVVSCSGSRYSRGCQMVEHFGFKVPEAILRASASKYQPGQPAAWRFKYKAKAFKDWQDGLLGLEIAGFLMAVDRYRSKMGFSATEEKPSVDEAVPTENEALPAQ